VLGTYKISPDSSTVMSVMVRAARCPPTPPGTRAHTDACAERQVTDREGNRLHSKLGAGNEGTFVFTAPTFSDFDVCFTNTVNPGRAPGPPPPPLAWPSRAEPRTWGPAR
jgi:hypothetical protein